MAVKEDIRHYREGEVCAFLYSRAEWGQLSNFFPLPSPIRAGPWEFPTSEHLYQAVKFPAAPEVQARIAACPTAREAARCGRGQAGLRPDWDAVRVNAMRWTLRMKREVHPGLLDGVLDASGARPIVEVSKRDSWWGAVPCSGGWCGHNVLGRLWMELRLHLEQDDPKALSSFWTERAGPGRLAEPPAAKDGPEELRQGSLFS